MGWGGGGGGAGGRDWGAAWVGGGAHARLVQRDGADLGAADHEGVMEQAARVGILEEPGRRLVSLATILAVILGHVIVRVAAVGVAGRPKVPQRAKPMPLGSSLI